jgi:tRNA(Ile)-lysidine synthase
VHGKSALLAKVEQFVGRVHPDRQPCVVAVSGGPDSVALLLALSRLRGTSVNPAPLVIAHFNHRLRGRDSDGDEHFVLQLHETLRLRGVDALEVRYGQTDVAAQARQEKGNLESVARRIRYAWLAETARSVGATFVATGHTADDQAETVLHRLLRGAGLRGLRGIAARRNLAPGIELIRPLLRVTRADVLAYLQAEGQTYREDASNANRDYTRNRIRHELLPQLARQYNPAIAPILGQLAEQAAQDYQDQEAKARNLLMEAERPRAGRLLVFAAPRLLVAPRHLIREVFRQVWRREGWPLSAMGFREWERLAAVACGEMVAVDLPGGVRARRRQHVVQIERQV